VVKENETHVIPAKADIRAHKLSAARACAGVTEQRAAGITPPPSINAAFALL
jgi:hypothetical protein